MLVVSGCYCTHTCVSPHTHASLCLQNPTNKRTNKQTSCPQTNEHRPTQGATISALFRRQRGNTMGFLRWMYRELIAVRTPRAHNSGSARPVMYDNKCCKSGLHVLLLAQAGPCCARVPAVVRCKLLGTAALGKHFGIFLLLCCCYPAGLMGLLGLLDLLSLSCWSLGLLVVSSLLVVSRCWFLGGLLVVSWCLGSTTTNGSW